MFLGVFVRCGDNLEISNLKFSKITVIFDAKVTENCPHIVKKRDFFDFRYEKVTYSEASRPQNLYIMYF